MYNMQYTTKLNKNHLHPNIFFPDDGYVYYQQNILE